LNMSIMSVARSDKTEKAAGEFFATKLQHSPAQPDPGGWFARPRKWVH